MKQGFAVRSGDRKNSGNPWAGKREAEGKPKANFTYFIFSCTAGLDRQHPCKPVRLLLLQWS